MGRGLAQGDFSSSPGSPPSPRIALPQVHSDILNIKFQISLPTFRDPQQKFLSITSDHASFSWLLWDRSPLDFLPLPQWLLSLLCPCITGLSSLACHLHLFPRVKSHKSHELGVLKQENCIVSKFWRLEVQNQRTDGAMHPHMSRGGAGRGGAGGGVILPCLLWLLMFANIPWHFSACKPASLQPRGCLLHHLLSVCLCANLPFF